METDNVWFDSVECTHTVQRRGRIGGGRVVVRVRRDGNAKRKSGTKTNAKENNHHNKRTIIHNLRRVSNKELGAQIESVNVPLILPSTGE